MDQDGRGSPDEAGAPDAADTIRRLRLLEGQVRGLQNMLAEGRDCTEILTQYLAVRAALEQVGTRLLEAEMARCLPGDSPGSQRIGEMLRLWLRVARR